MFPPALKVYLRVSTLKELMKIFVPVESKFYDAYNPDNTERAAGGAISTHNHIKALSKYCQVYLFDENATEIDTNIFGLGTCPTEEAYLEVFGEHKFDGALCPIAHIRWFNICQKATLNPIIVRVGSLFGFINRFSDFLSIYTSMNVHDAITTKTPSDLNFLKQNLANHNALYSIPNGIDHNAFFPMDKMAARQCIAEIFEDERVLTRPIVGFVSRVDPQKGTTAIFELARQMPHILFVIVGNRVGNFYYGEVPNNILLAGMQRSRHQLRNFYNAFDLFCFPSVYSGESFGSVVLESMACGVPVVATNIAGIPDVLGETGVIVPMHKFKDELGGFCGYADVESLRLAIEQLLNDNERRRSLGEKAHQRSLTYTWDQVAKDIIDLFHLLHEKKNHAARVDAQVQFAHYYDRATRQIKSRGGVKICGISSGITPLEGLALHLWSTMSPNQVEATLLAITEDAARVKEILDNVHGLFQMLPLDVGYSTDTLT